MMRAGAKQPLRFDPGRCAAIAARSPPRASRTAAAGACCLALLGALAVAQPALAAADARPSETRPAPSLPDLKQADAKHRVTAIRHCGDSYVVSTAARGTLKFWEFNLRFKTDSSNHGPASGHPVLVPQGMGGDRAQVVFATPAEISAFIKSGCGNAGLPPISNDPR